MVNPNPLPNSYHTMQTSTFKEHLNISVTITAIDQYGVCRREPGCIILPAESVVPLSSSVQSPGPIPLTVLTFKCEIDSSCNYHARFNFYNPQDGENSAFIGSILVFCLKVPNVYYYLIPYTAVTGSSPGK